MPKKPTGIDGVVKLSAAGITFMGFKWPTEKSAIEAKVLELFNKNLPKVERQRLGVDRAVQNEAEYDLDSVVKMRGGDRLMDLVEVAPLSKWKGYTNAPARTTVGEQADAIIDAIRPKAAKYASIKPPPLLLCYITHWAFRPSETALNVVRAELIRIPKNFEAVFFLMALDSETAIVSKLSPAPLDVIRLDTAALRKNWVINGDPRSAIAIPGADGEIAMAMPFNFDTP